MTIIYIPHHLICITLRWLLWQWLPVTPSLLGHSSTTCCALMKWNSFKIKCHKNHSRSILWFDWLQCQDVWMNDPPELPLNGLCSLTPLSPRRCLSFCLKCLSSSFVFLGAFYSLSKLSPLSSIPCSPLPSFYPHNILGLSFLSSELQAAVRKTLRSSLSWNFTGSSPICSFKHLNPCRGSWNIWAYSILLDSWSNSSLQFQSSPEQYSYNLSLLIWEKDASKHL